MNLDNARELKRRICEAGFTAGLSLTAKRAQFRVAVLPTRRRDRALLEGPAIRKLLDSARGEVEIDVASATPFSGSLQLGASVGHHLGGVGSLGFFARRRRDGARGLVSCNHVIALADGGQEGDAVLCPALMDGGAKPRDAIARLDGNYPRLGGAGSKLADCAFAVLEDAMAYEPSSLPGGKLQRLEPAIAMELAVSKVGRVTGARPGVIRRIEVDNVPMRYGAIKTTFDDVIQIASTSSLPFCEPGDSGALVYTADTFEPVGLLFAATTVGGPHDAGWTWVNPLRHVTTALDVELILP